ncbi:MAG: chromate transporter [Clostridia bacterium]|nr:chromate transporter [Clostridia bacterium]
MIYLELFLTFLQIGAFTFGGGYAMLPLVSEAVVEKGWLTEAAIIDFVAVSESTPGPFAVNIATYVGSEMGGVFGAVCATLGVILPSFIIILIVAKCFDKFKESRIVKGFMSGLKPCVIGLISAAIFSLGKAVLFPEGFDVSLFCNFPIYVTLATFLLCLSLAHKKVHPILIICLSAVIGIAVGYIPM